MKQWLTHIAAWLTLTLLAGCSTSPKVSFYTLSGSTLPEQTEEVASYAIAIGPVTVPEMVDRPQLVTRTGANQVAISETARWAEPLKSEIPRVIADNLRQMLEGVRVSVYPQSMNAETDVRLSIDVQHFDSALGDAVVVEVLWNIKSAKGTVQKNGRSSVREPVKGVGYDALVAAHGRALAVVSRDIAETVRALR